MDNMAAHPNAGVRHPPQPFWIPLGDISPIRYNWVSCTLEPMTFNQWLKIYGIRYVCTSRDRWNRRLWDVVATHDKKIKILARYIKYLNDTLNEHDGEAPMCTCYKMLRKYRSFAKRQIAKHRNYRGDRCPIRVVNRTN